MPTSSHQLDHEATVEELSGIGRNRRFEQIVDDEEQEDIQVICRKPNPNSKGKNDKYVEIRLAKPSRAFYFGDRNLYEQEAKRFDEEA